MICYDHLECAQRATKNCINSRLAALAPYSTLITSRKLQIQVKHSTSENAKQTKLNDTAVTIKEWIMKSVCHVSYSLISIDVGLKFEWGLFRIKRRLVMTLSCVIIWDGMTSVNNLFYFKSGNLAGTSLCTHGLRRRSSL
jgi:hypothetical protein